VKVLDRLVAERGAAPRFIRCDNGPELTVNALRDWCRFTGAETSYIKPGAPWQNPYVESFGGRLREELLAVEAFSALLEARCWSRTGGSSTTPSGPTAPWAA
jgi:putative transposase